MTFMQWSDAYRLRNPEIDDDHRSVLDIVARLKTLSVAGSDADDVATALARLAEVTDRHFEREEGMMQRHAYPYRAAHREQHRVLARDLHAVRRLHAADHESIDLTAVLQFLRAWWHHHILRADSVFVTFLESGAGSPPAAESVVNLANLDQRSTGAVEDLIAVTVRVPADRIDTLHACARLLRRGGPDAEEIVGIAHPLGTMTLDEAAVVARRLMR
jgi:hemerythrin